MDNSFEYKYPRHEKMPKECKKFIPILIDKKRWDCNNHSGIYLILIMTIKHL